MKKLILIFVLLPGCAHEKVSDHREERKDLPRHATAQAKEAEPLFSEVVEEAAIENGLPASLLFGLFWHESRFKEDAERSEPHLCRKHRWRNPDCRSYGIGQVILGYHRKTCSIGTARDLRDFHKAVPCAARILGGYLKVEKGNLKAALKRFNGPLGKNYAEKVIAEARRFGFQS